MTDEKTILAFAPYAYNRGHNDAGFIDAEALAKWAELSGQPAAPAQPVAAQPQSEWDAAIEAAAEICEKKATSHGWNYHSPSMGGELAHSIRALKRQPAQPVAAQQAATFTRHNKGGSGEFIGFRWNMPYADTLNLPDEGALYFGPPAQPVAAQPMPVAWRYKSVAIVDGVRVPIKQVDENRLEWEITQNPPRDHSNLSYPLNYPLISDYEPLYAAAPPAQQESKDAERWVACLRQEYDARAKISTESQKLAVPFEAYKADADKHMDAAIAASKSKGDA